jgi:hypothetical protein
VQFIEGPPQAALLGVKAPFVEEKGGMGVFDCEEVFLETWMKLFVSILQAESLEVAIEDPKVQDLWSEYLKLSMLAGPDRLQRFMKTALARLEKTAPAVAERLRNDLMAKGIARGKVASQGQA